MKQETRDYIEQVAYSLRASCNVPTPIRDIETLIENMGGTLEPANTKTVIQMGKVKKEGNKFAIRYMDKIEFQKDINWVVAVTIGHLVLHLRWGTNPKHWHSLPDANFIMRPDDSQAEQAYLFAMELLLPKAHLEEKFDEVTGDREELGFADLDVISDYFVVPTLYVYKRLMALGLIE